MLGIAARSRLDDYFGGLGQPIALLFRVLALALAVRRVVWKRMIDGRQFQRAGNTRLQFPQAEAWPPARERFLLGGELGQVYGYFRVRFFNLFAVDFASAPVSSRAYGSIRFEMKGRGQSPVKRIVIFDCDQSILSGH